MISILRNFFLQLLIFIVFSLGVSLEASTSSLKEYTNDVLHLIDEKEGTYLFRGKHPEHQGIFACEKVKEQIRDYLAAIGTPMPDDFKFICISLLNSFEISERRMEIEWSQKNPDQNCVLRYPLFGCFLNPCYIPPSMRKLFYALDMDGIQKLTYQLKRLVDGGYGKEKPCVIYMHCYAGKDRTGEAAACYLMEYKGYSYGTAVDLN